MIHQTIIAILLSIPLVVMLIPGIHFWLKFKGSRGSRKSGKKAKYKKYFYIYWILIPALFVIIGIYQTAKAEEELLIEQFGEEYTKYKQKVGMFSRGLEGKMIILRDIKSCIL